MSMLWYDGFGFIFKQKKEYDIYVGMEFSFFFFFFGFFFFQAEDGIRDLIVTGVQTCALSDLGRYVLSLYKIHLKKNNKKLLRIPTLEEAVKEHKLTGKP